MTITYTFGHPIELDYYQNDYVDDEEFEYEVDPTDEDYIDFIKESLCGSKKFSTAPERKAYKDGLADAVDSLISDYGLLDIFKESLEDDDDFYEFIKDRYYDEAMEELE